VVALWLKHCATSRNVAGWRPDKVIECFQFISPPHLRTETDPVLETLYFLVFRILNDGQIPLLLSVLHHHQNPSVSTCIFMFCHINCILLSVPLNWTLWRATWSRDCNCCICTNRHLRTPSADRAATALQILPQKHWVLHSQLILTHRCVNQWTPRNGCLQAWIWNLYYKKPLHDLYSSPSIIRIIRGGGMRWAGHVARMGGEEECV
jgi:hypothetical protein